MEITVEVENSVEVRISARISRTAHNINDLYLVRDINSPIYFHQSTNISLRNYFNMSYLTNSYSDFTLKMESVAKITIFGPKMTVKSALERIFSKLLHSEAIFF